MYKLIAITILGLISTNAQAGMGVTIASASGGTLSNSTLSWGQSFTVTGIGTNPANNIGFQFFQANSGTNTTALSTSGTTGYILSTALSPSTPASSLSSATPGYLGSVAGSGTAWTFASSLVLNGGTKYYFYEEGTALANFGYGSTYAGGNLVYSSSNGVYGSAGSPNSDFQVTATPTPVPPTGILAGIGMLALLGSYGIRRSYLKRSTGVSAA